MKTHLGKARKASSVGVGALALVLAGMSQAAGQNTNADPAGDGFTNLQKYRAGLNRLTYYPLQFTQAGAASGGFQVSVLGNLGASYVHAASSDLSSWSDLLTFTPTNIPAVVSDAGAEPNPAFLSGSLAVIITASSLTTLGRLS